MAKQGKTRPPAKAGASGQGGGSSAAPARKKTTNPLKFLGEVRQEGRKVTWTSRNETIISSILVFIMATLAAIFFFGVDFVISTVVNFILGLGA